MCFLLFKKLYGATLTSGSRRGNLPLRNVTSNHGYPTTVTYLKVFKHLQTSTSNTYIQHSQIPPAPPNTYFQHQLPTLTSNTYTSKYLHPTLTPNTSTSKYLPPTPCILQHLPTINCNRKRNSIS